MCTVQLSERNDFLLQGTQVNFSDRKSLPNSRMSSRPNSAVSDRQNYKVNFTNRKSLSNSGISSRPNSAVSDRQTYKKEKSFSVPNKRASSVDDIFIPDESSHLNLKDLNNLDLYDETLPTKDLPSSQLLKSLLSESITDRAWTKLKDASCENSSVNSTAESEESFGTKIKELAQKPQQVGTMLPGLVSKPPIPEKDKKKIGNNSSKNMEMESLHLDLFPKESSDIYDDLDPVDNCDTFETMFKKKSEIFEKMHIENYTFEDMDETDKYENLSAIPNHDLSLRLDLHLNENASNDSLKNWLQENNNLMLETKLFETQTDLDLQNLQQQHEELNENIYGTDTLLDLNLEKVSAVGSKEIQTKSANYNNKNFTPNKINTSVIKTNHGNNEKSNSAVKISQSANKKTPIKSILKPPVAKQPKKYNVYNPKSENKVHTIAKTLEKKSRLPETPLDDTVSSWMSTNEKPESFLEFLNKLDELEHIQENTSETQESYLQDVPEHDICNKINSSTCDEIASILEVLEKEDLKSQKNIESLKEILSTEIANSVPNKSNDTRSSSTTSLESSNYNDFLSYLEEVDQSCVKTLKNAQDRVRCCTKITNSILKVDSVPKLEELLNYSTVDLAHFVVDVSLRLKERNSGIQTLQSELSKLRNLINTKSEEFEKSLNQKLVAQKSDYESVIKRHQKFIDQLIADKKSLNQQCEGLISEMKILEDRYNTNLRTLEQRHKVDLQKAKEMHMAAEKLRRDKWIEGKTQKIKEMTVKGLEPELQNMTSRHQQELSDLRSLHKREIEDLELRNARKNQQQCESLRQQLIAEREQALAHERDVLRQRYEKLVESEEKGYQEQRRRLNAEHAVRMNECEERIAGINNEKDRAIEGTKAEFDDKLQIALRRHKTEVKNMKESVELEFEVWKNNFKKQQAIKVADIEAQLRDACKKERDKEIEMVIERLEQESIEFKTQSDHAAENRLRRMKEKYEEEIKDLEKLSEEYKTKYSDTKEKLLNQDDMILNLKTSVKQLQIQFQNAQKLSEELSANKSNIKDQVKEEFVTQIKTLEDEVKLLKNNKEEELQKIFSRVKMTVLHKDELLTELTKNNSNLQEKCSLLENLLEQQRKEYLIK